MTKKQIKLIAVAIAAIVVLIVILQNTADVETKLLFVDVTMPRALLLFIVGAIGFVLGLVTAAGLIKRKAGKKGGVV